MASGKRGIAMPMYKASLVFSFLGDPGFGNQTTPKAGGWTENIWVGGFITAAGMLAYANLRAAMMCNDCFITGWKQTPYVINKNQLIPGKASTGGLSVTGIYPGKTADPETALVCRATANAIPASFNYYLHALPPTVITSGAYTPTQSFETAYNLFHNSIIGLRGVPAQWLGRDPSQVAQRVINVNVVLGQIRLALPLPGWNVNDFIRLRRVNSDDGVPIKGTFASSAQVVNPDGTASYTLLGLPTAVRTTPSGTARRDVIASSPVTSFEPQVLGDHKIGRPSGLYRGRRSTAS
jgi:hypothetical protein